MSQFSQLTRARVLLVTLLPLVCALTGCQRPLRSGDFVQPKEPLSFAEQKQMIIQAAPLGTSRDSIEAKLDAAGIEGQFSAGKTLFYAEAMRRPDDTRWALEVNLLFDENGVLFDIQPRGPFVTGVEPAGTQHAGKRSPGVATPARPRRTAAEQNPFLTPPE
jgi:hypothetical protein